MNIMRTHTFPYKHALGCKGKLENPEEVYTDIVQTYKTPHRQ